MTSSTPSVVGAAAVEVPGRGTHVDRFCVTAPLHRGKHAILLQARDEDGSYVAIKLATTNLGGELIDREVSFLQLLDDGHREPVPQFIASGTAAGRPYCAMNWIRGAEVRVVAAELREEGSSLRLVKLCCGVARAYRALHERGFVHGHVHPGHVLVDDDGSVGLVDFALAAPASKTFARPPLLQPFYSLSAPEQAEAVLLGEDRRLTPAAEQFSVAALLYLLITGRMYARLRLEREVLAHDILAASPLPFSEHGLAPWPALEAVLARALSTNPDERYESADALVRALEAVFADAGAGHDSHPRPVVLPVQSPLRGLLEAFQRDAGSDSAIEDLKPPTCSVNLGAAGVAFALTRLGTITGDPRMLERAECWLSAAERKRTDPDAFNDDDELTPDTVGRVSPYHRESGLVAVRAFLADATGDHDRQQAALDAFRAATQAPCANLDLTLGRSSVLLCAALLYVDAHPDWPSTERLARYGDELCAGIWQDLAQTSIPYHGIAHGWGGIAYASLMWAQARGVEPPREVKAVLGMLSEVGEPYERGMRWPLTPMSRPGSDEYWPGWCHGNAGYVFLWNLARVAYQEEMFAELAERAAWLVGYRRGITSLCCGAAGQAYAALNQYRSTGEERWRDFALRIATRAATDGDLAADTTTPLSLYKGHVGLALLAAEFECPERAAMPLFEFEPTVAA